MNRTMIRGIAASTIVGALLAAAGIAGTALAQGPTSRPQVAVAALRPGAAEQPTPLARATVVRITLHASRSDVRLPLAGTPRALARMMLRSDGWSDAQWTCLDTLWTRESHWRVHAMNARSGAYGIPQAMPGWKMSRVAPDWRDNVLTQIRWGLWYIAQRYGAPCLALQHSNWYGYY